ncbi:MAG: tol-pal system protein YbgF [Alphaproteobacteria bacterium]|nr:tol-pal system protein YbgF [Alphaproteobacteria bacterium]
MTNPITRAMVATALMAGLCITTAVSAQESGSPLSAIGRMFGQKPPQTNGQEEADGPSTEQVLKIERLEAQIRQLTGTVEQLQYRNQQLENQLRASGGPVAQPAPPPPVTRPSAQTPIQAAPLGAAVQPPPIPPAPTGRRSDVFDPSQNPNAPGAPRTLGGPQNEPPPIASAEPPLGAPGGRRPGGPLDLTGPGAVPGAPADPGLLPAPPSRNLSATGAVASVAPPSDTPKDTYDLGYGYVLRKDYALAEETFLAFLKKYPNDRRAAEAEFWMGESMFQRQRYDAAAQAFLDVSTRYTTHAKAPEALLRLAQSLSAMKQKEMSCATLAEVGRKYPKASATVKQGVEHEQKRVRC